MSTLPKVLTSKVLPTKVLIPKILIPSPRDSWARPQGRALAVAASSAAAVVAWLGARPFVAFDVRRGSVVHHVGLGKVVVVSLAAALVGWALLATMERFTPRAGALWTTVALVVLAVSLLGPLVAGIGGATKAALAALHLAAAGVLIPFLGRQPERR